MTPTLRNHAYRFVWLRAIPCRLLMGLLSLCYSITASAQVTVTIDHNAGAEATSAFKFKRVPSPVKDDAASRAKVQLVIGEIDPAGAKLDALIDGILPTQEDQPRANFFFDSNSFGGRFQMDLGNVIDIAEVNTYSWHPNSRGPQVYILYGSDGASSSFDPLPDGTRDPTTRGWKVIAFVDTRSSGLDGGQYGVSVTDRSGLLGKYRYLLFDTAATETDDPWGNTFYSEIDVIAKR